MASRASKRQDGTAEDVVVAADDVIVVDEKPAASEPVAGTPVASKPATAPAPPATGAAGRWNEIQAMFVDDPRRSVELAAGMADKAIEDLVASFRQREAALTANWQNGDAGTEELRNALKDYRAFCGAMGEVSTSGLTAAAQAPRRRPAADA
jgi:hypothetical protein